MLGDASTIASESGTAVSVGSASTLALAENQARIAAIFTNMSNEAIDLAFGGAAVSGSGIRLAPAGSADSRYEINAMNLFTGAVYAICASGSKNLGVVEVGPSS